MTRIIILSFVAVLSIIGLFGVNHYVPFQIEVFVVYLCIGFFVVGLLSVIKPFRFFYIRSRKLALLLVNVGLLLFVTGLIFPSPMIRSKRPHQCIDDFMPEYQFYEYHEMSVNAPAEALYRAVREVAFNMHVVAMEDGICRLSSETRIIGVDASAQKAFSRYWRMIYPGSAIIRRMWIDAIADRAIKQ